MKIGDLAFSKNAFLAPMAGITHPVFRWMVSEIGGVMGFTEMVSAEGLVRDIARTEKYLKPFPGERPFAVQLFGADPGAMAAAALIAVERGADLIDINMGCPVHKVVKAGAGAALLKDPGNLGLLLRRVRDVLDCPLTIKIRAGWSLDKINAPEIAAVAEDSGVDAVTVHPRTAVQGYLGRADWRIIERVKKVVHIPVIGNGDIRNPEDAFRMVRETGCDGVMVGRGALGNPWIFRDIPPCLESGRSGPSPTSAEREAAVCRHLERTIHFLGERAGMKDFYRHLVWYTKGLKGCTGLRRQVLGVKDREAVRAAIRHFFDQRP